MPTQNKTEKTIKATQGRLDASIGDRRKFYVYERTRNLYPRIVRLSITYFNYFNPMKILRLSFLLVMTMFLASTFVACKKKCKDEPPQARIINNGTSKASVQIKTSNGSTVNINNVDPGTSSPYAAYSAGEITFTLSVNSTPYVKTVAMGNCYYYDIAIDKDNNITTAVIERKN